MPTQELIDDDDWVEVEPNAKASQKALADVTVRITVSKLGRNAKEAKARTTIAFRGEAAKWIEDNGPRFRILLGGQNVNCLRVAPDKHHGKFEFATARGETKMIRLGALTAWPREDREMTAASWRIDGNFMRLTLPDDFENQTSAPCCLNHADIFISARFGSLPSR